MRRNRLRSRHRNHLHAQCCSPQSQASTRSHQWTAGTGAGMLRLKPFLDIQDEGYTTYLKGIADLIGARRGHSLVSARTNLSPTPRDSMEGDDSTVRSLLQKILFSGRNACRWRLRRWAIYLNRSDDFRRSTCKGKRHGDEGGTGRSARHDR